VPLPSSAQQPDTQSKSLEQIAAQDAVVLLGSSYVHFVPVQHEYGSSRHDVLAGRH